MKTVILIALLVLGHANAQVMQQAFARIPKQGPVVPVPTTKTCSNYAASGTTVTCTFSSSPVAGESIFVGVWEVGSGTFAVTDSAGDTYTAAAAAHTPTYLTGYSTQLFYTAAPISTTVTTITVTQSAGSGAGTLVDADSATGIAASSPLDGSVCYADYASGTSYPCLTAITTTVANDYVFCHGFNNASTLETGAGFTGGASFNANFLAQYKIQSSAGSFTPAYANSATTSMSGTCAAFKP